MNKIKPIVFVASPFQGPDENMNIDFARRLCREIALKTGAMPFAPHLLFPQFLNDKEAHERDLGISYCSTMLALSKHATFGIPKWRNELSTGMRHEFLECYEIGTEHSVGVDWDPELERFTKPPGRKLEDVIAELARRFPK